MRMLLFVWVRDAFNFSSNHFTSLHIHMIPLIVTDRRDRDRCAVIHRIDYEGR